MSLELTHYCPSCGEDRTFYRTASTLVHIGEKTKWSCPECDYGFVKIGELESDANISA
jgi:rubredoxin